MLRSQVGIYALVATLMCTPAQAVAQTAAVAMQPSPDTVAAPVEPARSPFETRAMAMPALLAEGSAIETAFAPNFLAAVPVEQVRTIFASLRAEGGAPARIVRLTRGASEDSGTIIVGYERADVTFEMAVDASGRIAGLRITNVAAANDSIARLSQDFDGLAGRIGWGIYRIGPDGTPRLLHGSNTADHRAIGSSFKLAILGAIDAQIAAGGMNWDDVVRIDRQSVPSSAMLNWPASAPITLHSLATLMVSVSDNRATDILLHHVGRERIEAFARAHGGLSGPNAFPLLSTLEATVLKNPMLGAAHRGWLSGSEAQRRAILATNAENWSPTDADYAAFANGPANIDAIEWFASPDSVAQLLGWFATSASPDARAILAVNPGVAAAAAQPWAYVGYKGGSEPGVMAMNFLLRAQSGEQFAVAIAWNDPNRAVDEARLASLATRAVALMLPVSPPPAPPPAP